MKNKHLILLLCFGMTNIMFSQKQSFKLDYSKKTENESRYYFSQDATQNMPVFGGGGGVVMSGMFNHKVNKSGSKINHELGFTTLSAITYDKNRTMYYQPTGHVVNKPLKLNTNLKGGSRKYVNSGTMGVVGNISPSTTTELRFFLPELPEKKVTIGDTWETKETYTLKKDERKGEVSIEESMTFTVAEYIKDYKDPLSNGGAWKYDVIKITGKGTKKTNTQWGPNKVVLTDFETFTGYFAPKFGMWVLVKIESAGTAGDKGVMGWTNKYIYWPPAKPKKK